MQKNDTWGRVSRLFAVVCNRKEETYHAVGATIALDVVLLPQLPTLEHHRHPLKAEKIAQAAKESAVAVEELDA